jgi:murein DD-endopeptidase MepM/ murein hydrolase activator NlpD
VTAVPSGRSKRRAPNRPSSRGRGHHGHVESCGDQAVTWTAIALAESGGNTSALNAKGEHSVGLWQININPSVRNNVWGNLEDPLVNARAAYDISEQGSNLRPWTVTHASNAGTAKDYRNFIDEAQEAANGQFVGDFRGVGGYDDSDGSGGAFASASVPTGADFVQPVAGAELVDTWHAPRSGGRVHEGIDIFADAGTPIQAISGGKIVRGFDGGELGGVVVRIEGDDGQYYYYAHLQEGSTDHLSVGQRVEAGEQIGAVGNTGNAASTPAHLHLGIQDDGEWINPYDFLLDLPSAEMDELLPAPTGPDSDADGLSDYDEIEAGADPNNPDSDADGLLDGLEVVRFHTSPIDTDTDDDSLSDAYEIARTGTDPTKADTDFDGLRDDLEVGEGRDPLRGTAQASALHNFDPDDPATATDSDADSLTDAYETALGLDPARADTDFDGLADALEIDHGTNATSFDTDADGLGDLQEIEFGTDPFSADLAFESTDPAGGLGLTPQDPTLHDHADHDQGLHALEDDDALAP